MAETRTVPPAPLDAAFAAKARAAATVGLAVLAAVLCYQILGEPLAALGAFLGSGLVAGLAWGALVIRPTGISLGAAALTGVLALAAGYVGAGLVGAGGSRVVTDRDAAVALLFSFWLVLPVMVAGAVGLAVVTRILAARRDGSQAAD